jgi:uncharacterized RDD family membrane protein YckC
LSTSVNISSSWKQEVNRRVAAHLNRKNPLTAEQEAAQEIRPSPGSRAAQAAARVAARYAAAPSYSEMLANEARAAMMAAEAASRAAQEAHAAAQSVLDSLEAAASADRTTEEMHRTASARVLREETALAYQRESALVDRDDWAERGASPTLEPAPPNAAHTMRPEEEPAFAIRWEPDLPVRQPEQVPVRPRHDSDLFDYGVQDWPEPGSITAEMQEFEMVEPGQPIHANLIEFPRELVATRKVRPRLAEGPLAMDEPGSQLSIFEVDPGAISVEPELTHRAPETSAPAWTGPEWSGIRLDAQPEKEPVRGETPLDEQKAPALEQAPASRRLLAVVVDVALVAGAFLTAAIVAGTRTTELPGMHAIEFGSAFALLAAGAAYLTLFFVLAKGTPGMKYAQVRLCTFEGQTPTRAQRSARLVALLLSVLPVGVGLAWAIFDEDHLTWHDRLSQTYLRRG